MADHVQSGGLVHVSAGEPESDPAQVVDRVYEALFSASVPPHSSRVLVDSDRALAEALRSVSDALARERMMLEVYRWWTATGDVPGPEQWSEIEGCPRPEEAERLFGDWGAMIEASGIREYPLVVGLAEFGRALAAQRAAEADRRRQVEHRERELEHRHAQLEEREREMRARITGEVADRLERAEQAAETARRDQEQAEQRARDAVGRAVEAEQSAVWAEEGMQGAVRRVHALTYEISRTSSGETPMFAAWFVFTGGNLDALVDAAARGIAGGRLHQEIVAAQLGSTELPCSEGFIEVSRAESGGTVAVEITHSESIERSSLMAHRRMAVTLWAADGQLGASTRVSCIGSSIPVLATEQLSVIAGALIACGDVEPDAGWPLSLTATWVHRPDVDEFLQFLEHPKRTRPVLALTPRDDGEYLLDPDQLAGELCGAAHVVRVDREAAYDLSQRVGRQLSVWGGAARCYRPGFASASPPGRHPLIMPAVLGRPGAHEDLLTLAGLPAAVPERYAQARDHAPDLRASPPTGVERASHHTRQGTQTPTEREAEAVARAEVAERDLATAKQQIESLHAAGLDQAELEAIASGNTEAKLHRLISREWLRALTSAEDRARFPPGGYVFGPKFIKSVEELPSTPLVRIAFVCAMVASGRAQGMPGLEPHKLRIGGSPSGLQVVREDDGAKAWICRLLGPGATRLHYWAMPGLTEFATVRNHQGIGRI
jgi:hypothetical protein